VAELINRKDVNLNKWNALVQSDVHATIFNYSHYIDSLAENWYLYTDEVYSFGIIIPSKTKLNQKIVYTPFFYRYSDLVGNAANFDEKEFIYCIKSNFDSTNLSLSFQLNEIEGKKRTFQIIENEKLKSLAKRQLKKISNYSIELAINNEIFPQVTTLIFDELSQKIPLYQQSENKALFLRLIKDLKDNNQLVVLSAHVNGKLVGGVIGMNDSKRLTYLKGACTSELKDEGLMYLLINKLISHSQEHQLLFDFGGSSNENVRFFNTRFNGIDQSYYVYCWENGPFWFKTLKNLKKWIKK
jgi:hypothetical protein